MIRNILERIKAWWYLDSIVDAARAANEDKRDLAYKYQRLAVAAGKVVADKNKPVGWPALQNDIAKLEMVLRDAG